MFWIQKITWYVEVIILNFSVALVPKALILLRNYDYESNIFEPYDTG